MMTSNLVPTTLTPPPLAAPAFQGRVQEVRRSAQINKPPEHPPPESLITALLRALAAWVS
jgi:hypothetical protein